MKSSPKIGDTGQVEFTVEADHAIDLAEGRVPLVLSTPWLVWFLEQAARRALAPLLEDAESCVGTQVDVQHLAPTPVGEQVTCQARVIHCEGSLVTFQLEAHDQHERIARGLHKRAVIRLDRFRARVTKKS
jgi:predicted thioesterase